MNIFSDERVDCIAETIYQELLKRNLISKTAKSYQIKSEVKKAYIKFYRLNEDISKMVLQKIRSMSNAPEEGTSAFKVLYDKYFLAEWQKH